MMEAEANLFLNCTEYIKKKALHLLQFLLQTKSLDQSASAVWYQGEYL